MKRSLFVVFIMAGLGISLMVTSIAQSPLPSPSYTLTVNYDQPLAQQIAAGRFDRVQPDINVKNFPAQSGQAKINLVLVSIPPNKMTSTVDVQRLLEAQGLRSATLAELLAFDAARPTEYRQGPIAALGSSWIRSQFSTEVPTLDKDSGKRWLWLRPTYLDWPPRYRFLAVKK